MVQRPTADQLRAFTVLPASAPPLILLNLRIYQSSGDQQISWMPWAAFSTHLHHFFRLFSDEPLGLGGQREGESASYGFGRRLSTRPGTRTKGMWPFADTPQEATTTSRRANPRVRSLDEASLAGLSGVPLPRPPLRFYLATSNQSLWF